LGLTVLEYGILGSWLLLWSGANWVIVILNCILCYDILGVYLACYHLGLTKIFK
jgi:hypothetical protein